MRYKRLFFQAGTFGLLIILYLSIFASSFIHYNPQFQIIGEVTRFYSSNQEETLRPVPRKIIEIAPSEYVGLWYDDDTERGINLVGYSTNGINWKIHNTRKFYIHSFGSDCIILGNKTLLIYYLDRFILNYPISVTPIYSPNSITMWSITNYDSIPKMSFKILALDPNNTRDITATHIRKINNSNFANVRLFYDRGLHMCSINHNNTIKIWSLPDNMNNFSQISAYQPKNFNYSIADTYFYLTEMNQKILIYLGTWHPSENGVFIFWDQENNNWQEYLIDLSVYHNQLIVSKENIYFSYLDANRDFCIGKFVLNPTSQRYFLSNKIKLLSHEEMRGQTHYFQTEFLTDLKIFFIDRWGERLFLYEERTFSDFSGLGSGLFLLALSIVILVFPVKYVTVLLELIQRLWKDIR